MTHHSDGTNRLVLAPTFEETLPYQSPDLGLDLGSLNFLGVTLSGSPETLTESWYRQVGLLPANTEIVRVGTSQAPASPGQQRTDGRTVTDLTDLTGLSIAIAEVLSEWRAPDKRTIIWVESLSVLVAQGDLDRVFRFLKTLTDYVTKTGGVATYQLDPALHDDHTLTTLRPLFEQVHPPDVDRVEDGAVDATQVSPSSPPAGPFADPRTTSD